MSKNRKRSTTVSLQDYENQVLSSIKLHTKTHRSKYVAKKKYTFGLPPELSKSPVHSFYKHYIPEQR